MNQNNSENTRISPPGTLSLVGLLSCSITIVLSIVYIALCSLAIYVRNNCDAGITSQSGPGSSFFKNALLKLYFKQEDCTHSVLLSQHVTQERTVFTLVCITLAVSLICLMLAVGFLAVLKIQNAVKFIQPLGYCYVCALLLSLATDLTMSIHFGMDYNTFGAMMDNSSPGVSVNYVRDMYRLGALLLAAISSKGFIYHILNIVLGLLIILNLIEFTQKAQKEEHSIHKVGALKAYDQPRRIDEQSENSFQPFRPQPKRNDDPWQNTSENNYAPYRGPHVNPVFVNDDESSRAFSREPPRSEFTNPSIDRSYSWQHNQPSLASSQPFSYLENTKRQAPLKAPSPTKEPQWQRDPWDSQAPHVPAPDYSPDTPRRLKSALKSSYM